MKVQLLLSLTFVISFGVSEQSYDYLCVSKHGDYLAHPTDCLKFLHCSHGRAYEFKCPGNLLWHQKVKSCDFHYRTKCKHESNATKAKWTTKTNSASTVNNLKLSGKEILVPADKISKLLTTVTLELSTEGNPTTSHECLKLSTKGNPITSDKFLELSTKVNTIASADILELSTKRNVITSDNFLKLSTENIPKILKDDSIIISSKFPELIAKESTVSAGNIPEISTSAEIITESITLTHDNASFSADDISEVSIEAGTVTIGTVSITLRENVSFTADDISELSTEANTSTFGTVTELFTDLNTENLSEPFVATYPEHVLNNVTEDRVPGMLTELDVLTEPSIEPDTVILTEEYMESFTIDLSDELSDNITADNISDADTLTTEFPTESSIDSLSVKLPEHYMDLFTINFTKQPLENISEGHVSGLSLETDPDEVGVTSVLSTDGVPGNENVTYTVNPMDVATDNVKAELSTIADTVVDSLTDQQLSTEADFINLKETLTENTTTGKLEVATIPDIETAPNVLELSAEANATNFEELLTDNTTTINFAIVNISELLTETDTINLTAASELQISAKDTSITTIKKGLEIIEYPASTTTTPTTITVNLDNQENSFSENRKHTTSQDKNVLKLQGKNLGYVQINATISTTSSTIPTLASIPANSQAIDTTTQDPRLPFRAIECQGESNRRQFKAMECYQYYQCFAGWAFLLNCHEGWRFAVEVAGCVLDVDKECGY